MLVLTLLQSVGGTSSINLPLVSKVSFWVFIATVGLLFIVNLADRVRSDSDINNLVKKDADNLEHKFDELGDEDV